jgi:uncharacterized Zn-binding protein involved in type VI secretion
MPGQTLTQAATLMCPHGGTVVPIPANPRVTAGAVVLTNADTFTIAGCAFAPGGAASPCLTVQWLVSDSSVTVGGAKTLSTSSSGLCMNGASVPQGAVVVASTQTRVSTR